MTPTDDDAIEIRPERAEDHAAIRAFVKTAFETAKVASGTEQDFVDRLRASPDYCPDLALVAVAGERIVGHVMLTTTAIATAAGPRQILLLAPLAVALDRRRRGLGARLVAAASARARAAGHDAIVLVGDPTYYARFGFRRSTEFGIDNTAGIPDVYVQVAELVPGALAGAAGTIDFAT
jgi:putative acetyltransferase